jgi:phosphatidylglycerol:prolipoprotein diacylglycerol transferase
VFPRLFQIGHFSLPTYGVMAALGLITGLYIVGRNARQQGIDPDKAWNLGIIAILSAIIGAKILMVVNDWGTYWQHPSQIFSLSTLQAGGVFYGGLLAAIAMCIWYIRRSHLPVLRTCDVFAPAIAIGHALGRIGCFAAGCCYGKPTSLPWGVTFTNPLAADFAGTPLNEPLHPTQLYEFVLELSNFLFLYWLLRHKRFEGQVIAAYMFIYGLARFFFEFVRNDPERGSVFGGLMTGTQLISIFLVIAGGLLWLRGSRARQPVVATAAQ